MIGKLFPILAALCVVGSPILNAAHLADDPQGKVDFSTRRAPDEKRYRFETEYLSYALDGTRTGTEKVIMECAVAVDDAGAQLLECRKFELVDAAGRAQSIPRLVGWKNSIDAEAQEALGVTHADFLNLTTDDGTALRPDLMHRVYNTFIDFYAFNNVFGQAAPHAAGSDIADLTAMGEVIEHYSAYSEPPADLGDAVKKGSYFKNGRVTLEWLGIGRVNQQSCAIVRFDSGESSFQMLMEPAPDTSMRVKGGSHYWGDLFVNLDDYWLERATFKEVVITEIVFGTNPPAATFVKRIGTISLMP